MTDNSKWPALDLCQTVSEFGDSLQENIFRFDRDTIFVLRTIMPPVVRQM
jgi:hypothetical protein